MILDRLWEWRWCAASPDIYFTLGQGENPDCSAWGQWRQVMDTYPVISLRGPVLCICCSLWLQWTGTPCGCSAKGGHFLALPLTPLRAESQMVACNAGIRQSA